MFRGGLGMYSTLWMTLLLVVFAALWVSLSGSRKSRRYGFRPCLEALEERWCPIVSPYVWSAAGAGLSWTDSNNWLLNGAKPPPGDYPGWNNNANHDTAKFDGTAGFPAYITSISITIDTLQITTTQTDVVNIGGSGGMLKASLNWSSGASVYVGSSGCKLINTGTGSTVSDFNLDGGGTFVINANTT
jgi:hypothetical protein